MIVSFCQEFLENDENIAQKANILNVEERAMGKRIVGLSWDCTCISFKLHFTFMDRDLHIMSDFCHLKENKRSILEMLK